MLRWFLARSGEIQPAGLTGSFCNPPRRQSVRGRLAISKEPMTGAKALGAPLLRSLIFLYFYQDETHAYVRKAL
jgi:hypothetical protein